MYYYSRTAKLIFRNVYECEVKSIEISCFEVQKNKQIMKTDDATNRPQKYTPKYTESVTIRTV